MKTKNLTPKQLAYWKGQLNKHNQMMRDSAKAEQEFFQRARKAGFKLHHPKTVPLTFCGIRTKPEKIGHSLFNTIKETK